MTKSNYFKCEFSAISQNEALARAVVSAFLIQFDPTIEELSDMRTAISEAVTNSIIHGYRCFTTEAEGTADAAENRVEIECWREGETAFVSVTDRGCGIENIEQARQPLYTSAPELERSGLGFSIMESFCDSMEVVSELGKGTRIVLTKAFDKPQEG